ncbi:kxDL motif-containing protein 1 isoform X1 [Pleurodeles waltl]|uniref:kxDL motif-containing protein 1 isoform X1 n=1 Tax=Pleurodeles waltl TaxID=8319 RepID=UPI003709BB4B
MDPTASGVFCGRMLSMVNSEDVNAIILAQRHMLDRFEKTNEMLLNFNNLSNGRMQQMNERFLNHTRTLVDMKKELDMVFRRIRTLKGKLAKQYPEAFSMWPIISLMLTGNEFLSLASKLEKERLPAHWPGTATRLVADVHESPILEDDDDFDPVPRSVATTVATSEQATESCDTSPDIISPTMSQDFEDLSLGQSDTPSVNGQNLTDEETQEQD